MLTPSGLWSKLLKHRYVPKSSCLGSCKRIVAHTRVCFFYPKSFQWIQAAQVRSTTDALSKHTVDSLKFGSVLGTSDVGSVLISGVSRLAFYFHMQALYFGGRGGGGGGIFATLRSLTKLSQKLRNLQYFSHIMKRVRLGIKHSNVA